MKKSNITSRLDKEAEKKNAATPVPFLSEWGGGGVLNLYLDRSSSECDTETKISAPWDPKLFQSLAKPF